MGITQLELMVMNPANLQKKVIAKFLVDSGAAYTVIPSQILKKIGIIPVSTKRFILANGETVEWPVGNAIFKYQNETGASPVIFGDQKDIYLLGIVTLESLELILDPIRRQLKPLPMLLM